QKVYQTNERVRRLPRRMICFRTPPHVKKITLAAVQGSPSSASSNTGFASVHRRNTRTDGTFTTAFVARYRDSDQSEAKTCTGRRPWHARGRRFDPDRLHFEDLGRESGVFLWICSGGTCVVIR